jgi:hypothetical protein
MIRLKEKIAHIKLIIVIASHFISWLFRFDETYLNNESKYI